MAAHELLTTLGQKVAPEDAALLVIDVQNDFVAENGFFHKIGVDVAFIQQSIPRLKRFIDAARSVGVPVIFVRAIYDPPVVSNPMRERNLRRGVDIPRCITGSWGAEFFGLEPLPGEPVVVKHRYSAFTNPELETMLRARGISSLLLTGVSTDTCVESTGRDFYFADFYVTLVEDCCGAASQSDHHSALARFDRDYGAVVTSDEVIRTWRLAETSARPNGNLANV